MKKVLAIAVVAAVGVATGWAQTTNIVVNQELTITGKLSPSGTAVTGASLSGNDNAISYLQLQIISGTTTNVVQGIGQVVGSNATVFLNEVANVDLTPNATKSDKWINVFASGDQVGSSSNAVLLVSGSQKTSITKGVTNIVISGKITGIWVSETDSSGGQSVAGSITSVKAK
ncbi:MAG: hypothetical protein ABSD58_12490 [Verrucomicrobiia bacterium]|jgi:hypothetical protein